VGLEAAAQAVQAGLEAARAGASAVAVVDLGAGDNLKESQESRDKNQDYWL
jgi:hypothetical protein